MGANRLAPICEELETLVRHSALDGTPAWLTMLKDEFTRVRHALHKEQRSAA
jgi:hypothetical protein